MVLALVFLVLATAGGFALWLNSTVEDNVSTEALLPTGDDAKVTTPDGQEVTVPTHGKGQNYLFIGSDARPGDSASRSDVIIVAHIPEDRSQVQLIHFPRDLYVQIPGRGKDKINAAYAYGGAPLLVRTLQNLLGIRIDHVAKTDFTGFQGMTDAVGGVRVYAEEASNGRGNGGQVVIRKGWNDLNGEQALMFVRERYQLSEGDISRGKRQMAFIKALMTKAISTETITNPVRVAKFTDAATQNLVIDQDLTVAQMRSEGFALRNIRSKDIVFITAPWTGFGTAPNGGSIVLADQQALTSLGTHLREDRMSEWKDSSVTP